MAAGGTATFKITVTNTGDVTLSDVTVSDPHSRPTAARAWARWPPASSKSYGCSKQDVTADFVNVATATGKPPTGSDVKASDHASVTAKPFVPPARPAIGIVKDPSSQTVAAGGTATFKITVTNTGDVTLSDVTVDDPLSTDCSQSLGTLAAGQSKSYGCSKQDVTADFVNVATATGKPPTGSEVKASDHASVTAKPLVPPARPAIGIVKSPKSQTLTTKVTTSQTSTGSTKTVVHYGTAHFTIRVTNDGNVALHEVKVDDPASPACNHSIGSLAAGASKHYSCSRSAVASSFTNVATAVGTSPSGEKVKASDHADVKVKVKTTSTSGAKFTG